MRVDDFINKTSDSREQGEESIPTKVLWSYTILDASGSMDGREPILKDGVWMRGPSKFESAVNGIRADIQSMREDKTGVKFKVAIIEFDGNYNTLGSYYRYKVKPCDISEVNYIPGLPAGGTPLLATIGEVITDIRKIKPKGEPCIITVFTDGGENTSTGSPWAMPGALKGLIAAANDDLISVKFLGTDQDVENMISAYGISRGNTFKYENSAQGMERGFAATSSARSSMTKGYAGGQSVNSMMSMDFFAQPEDNNATNNPPPSTNTPSVSPLAPENNQNKEQKKTRSTNKKPKP